MSLTAVEKKTNSLPVKENIAGLKRVKNADVSRLGFLRLDKNENILPWPKEIRAKFLKVLTQDFISAYPEVDVLYTKLAKHLGCERENIFLSAGSDAAIKAVFEAFVCPGDSILLLSPTYAMFYVYAKMFQANLIEVSYNDDLTLSTANLLAQIEQAKPKLVCIANPNSPTGTVIAPYGIKEIIELCARTGSIVLMDEAYYLFYPHSAAPLINQYENLVITRTFSKAFGLASARLGYNLGHRNMIEVLAKTRPMYETNAYALKLGEIILDHYPAVKKNLKEALAGKKYLESELTKAGFKFYPSYANFINIDVGSAERAGTIAKLLEKKKILVKGSFSSPLERCIRANIGSRAQMKKFITALKSVSKK